MFGPEVCLRVCWNCLGMFALKSVCPCPCNQLQILVTMTFRVLMYLEPIKAAKQRDLGTFSIYQYISLMSIRNILYIWLHMHHRLYIYGSNILLFRYTSAKQLIPALRRFGTCCEVQIPHPRESWRSQAAGQAITDKTEHLTNKDLLIYKSKLPASYKLQAKHIFKFRKMPQSIAEIQTWNGLMVQPPARTITLTKHLHGRKVQYWFLMVFESCQFCTNVDDSAAPFFPSHLSYPLSHSPPSRGPSASGGGPPHLTKFPVCPWSLSTSSSCLARSSRHWSMVFSLVSNAMHPLMQPKQKPECNQDSMLAPIALV